MRIRGSARELRRRSVLDKADAPTQDWGVTWDEHIRPQRHYLALSDGSPMRLDLLAHIKDTADAWLVWRVFQLLSLT